MDDEYFKLSEYSNYCPSCNNEIFDADGQPSGFTIEKRTKENVGFCRGAIYGICKCGQKIKAEWSE